MYCKNIHGVGDLLLINQAFDTPPAGLDVPRAPYPGEALVWLDIDAPVDALFSETGAMLLAAEPEPGAQGWRLLLSPHGYLRFETGEGPEQLWVESRMPLLSFLGGDQPFRVGVSISNYAFGRRGTGYEKEGLGFNRIRLYVANAPDAELMVCGWRCDFFVPALAAAPRRLVFAGGAMPAFRGRLAGVCVYCTQHAEMLARPALPSAEAVVPPIPGGGGFNARWTAADAIEVFGRPEFCDTGSAWVYLKIADPTARVRHVSLRILWHGIAAMAPVLFVSSDNEHWRRMAPDEVEMREGSNLYTVRVSLTEQQARGCWIASAIPFTSQHRTAFLDWAQAALGARVCVPGQSAQGRDIPVARIGADEPGRFHAVFICGQHSPAEIMGAHAMRPMLEEAGRLGIMSQCVFHIVPTVNVDCAHYGGNGLNANERNTNRHWFDDIQPENQAVINYLELLRAQGARVGLGMDLHAGGVWRNHVLMHAIASDDIPLSRELAARQEVWSAALERHAGLRRHERAALRRRRLRATDLIMEMFDCPAFCLELSLCSWYDPVRRATAVFARESLDVVGRGIARAIAEHLRAG